MTKLHTNITWRGALYNMLRGPGRSIKAAVQWLRDERDTSISAGALYKKLDGTSPAETVTVELAELLTEYALAHGADRQEAIRWIRALAARYEAVLLDLYVEGDEMDAGVTAIQDRALLSQEINGQLIAQLRESLADLDVCQNDADRIGEKIMVLVYALLRLKRKVDLAAGRSFP
ncbi:MAG: hypothetical protein ABN482_10490 [Corticimicrobacter sp.]|uniref:hypothetical protein n=1 Tax=Corticimicrobacter sp. TaxID=2678536 RepID=UPI0032DA7422